MSPIIICIDGNIGAGKSSVLDELERRGHFVFKEDLVEWGWCLEKYYNDQSRWAFTLQMAVLRSMARQYQRMLALNFDVIFVERSPESGMVFTRNSHRRGTLNENELHLIGEFYSLFGWTPHTTILLNVSAERCIERVRRRNRSCEVDLQLDYLKVLEEEYANLDGVVVRLANDGRVHDAADAIETIVSSLLLNKFPPDSAPSEQSFPTLS